MAHIKIRRNPDGISQTLIVDGVDFSDESYAGTVELVRVGDGSQHDEIGLRFTVAASQLDIGDDTAVALDETTMDAVNERLRAVQEHDL